MLRNRIFQILLICLLGQQLAFSQTDLWTAAYQNKDYPKWTVDATIDGWFPMEMFNDDKQYIVNYTGKQVNLIVPVHLDYAYLVVEIRGGDGGSRSNHSLVNPLIVEGGGGATLKGYYRIGNGENQINKEDNLRFIIGSKGENIESAGTSGANGGAGTGLFYNKKRSDTWVPLMVAGGGGGAYSDCCTVISRGRSASESPDGKDGGGDIPKKGGKNGADGESPAWQFHSYGGGGLNGALDNGEPVGSTDSNTEALFGCGHGGYGDLGGGGGGGYSGGGGGRNYASGGGGGSYFNPDFGIYSVTINGQTSSPQDGYIIFRFTNDLPGFQAIRFAHNTNKCIDDTGSSTSNGTNILSYSCTGNPNQNWWINTDDRSIHSELNFNKCLDLANSNTNNGANIQLYDCNGTSAQKWVYNGLYKTIHSGVNSDKCFDAKNATQTVNLNVNLQLWDCQYNNNNQKWNIDGATTVSNVSNMKHIVPVAATGFAVHSHTGAESGSNIQLWTKDNTNTAEQWYFDGLAIKMRDHQNLCIDLSSSNTDNGNNIQLYNCNGTNAQKWLYDGMTKSIRSVVNPDKCMQIEHNSDGVYGKRSNVQINDCNGSQEQQFLIQE